MDDGSFDALTRRASLLSLGAVGLAAALASPFTADAKKKGGKNKNKKKKCPDCPDLCTPQVAQCTTAITTLCAGEPTCLDSALCCPTLASCDFSGFFACLVASSQA